MSNEENVDYVEVSVILKGNDKVVEFNAKEVGMDEEFLNIVPSDDDSEDLISINKESIVVVSSRKVYKAGSTETPEDIQ